MNRGSSVLLLGLLACAGEKADSPADSSAPGESSPPDSQDSPVSHERFLPVAVLVKLDGEPVEGAVLTQGGNPETWTTGTDGAATVVLDTTVRGDPALMASHPDARIDGVEIDDEYLDIDEPLEIALVRFSTTDNLDYVFQDPGDPDHRDTTGQCAHCHIAINDDWYGSAHRQSASNPQVHDLYAGAAAAYATEDDCVAAGGRWWEGVLPGTGARGSRCYLGDGALQALNDCGETAPCDGLAANTGGCADCHAPGIDGALGGRDLLEATGHAYDYGVHCDVCHKVEGVDLDAEPGVAGRLRVLRPSEDSPSAALGEWLPLTFGPYADVLNPRMGSVYRDHFRSAELCAGCHELVMAPAVDGAAADADRWPDGRLPIQTTYSEWLAGPYGDAAPCQTCHMPPDASAGNGADLGVYINEEPDLGTGWYRPVGEVKRHTWTGPRTPDGRMLQLAAALFVEAVSDPDSGELVVTVQSKNVGAGHAIPTGEPMRSIVLVVEARCDGASLTATGGDAVPDFGGWLDRKVAGEDWSRWPGASPGDVLRVVARTGDWRDYEGYGPFGDGRFDAEDKGLPVEHVVGFATVLGVAGDVVTLDGALPAGDVVYRGEAGSWPATGDPISALAGAPGFGFARVLEGPDGARGVPGFRAVDVVSDNRLLPQSSFTTEHRFAGDCEDPDALDIRAALLYRAYPLDLARERGWEAIETVMVEGRP